LIGTYFSARVYGEVERRRAISTFTQVRSQSDRELSGVRGSERIGLDLLVVYGAPDQKLWSDSRVRAYAARGTDSTNSLTMPAALLRIGSVHLEVPVYTDATERNLNRGAGLVAGTARPGSAGNIAIAAHRDGYFRALKDVAVGDVVELESWSQKQRYRVVDLAVVEPTELWPLDETEQPTVTLVTCYPFYFVGSAPQRYIVRAVAME
jgi:sortase A